MAETTVEIEKTVTEEEQLTICDACSREVDGEGVKDVKCDFCSECKGSYAEGQASPEDVMTTEQWKNDKARGGNSMSPQYNLETAKEVQAYAFFATFLAIGGMMWFNTIMPIVALVVVYFFTMIWTWNAITCFIDQYVEATDN